MINAKEAIEIIKHNIKLRKENEKIEAEIRKKAEEEYQENVDKKWMQDAIKEGDLILDCIINYSPAHDRDYGMGKKNKHNRYMVEYDSGIYMTKYEFYDIISDNAAKYIESHYENLGYGCEVVKPRQEQYGSHIEAAGTIYLWIPIEEDIKENKNNNIVGISW